MNDHTSPEQPAVWVDGDPLMEAIAAAVWEQCGRSDSGMCVEDDPRNIAAAAVSAVRPPATSRTALREQLTEALGPLQGTVHHLPPATRQAVIDAVVPVLPEPADRAAVLREAADVALGRVGLFPDTEEGALAAGALEGLADVYRRMAGSAGHACSNCEGVDPDSCLMNPDRTRDPKPALHVGGKANAEDCPGCKADRRNLPYPFLCPADPDAPAVGGAQQQAEARP